MSDALKIAIREIENNKKVGTEAAMLIPNQEEQLNKLEERYTLRHKASTFSCYVGSEEKEQKLSKKETKTKKLLKRIFGF